MNLDGAIPVLIQFVGRFASINPHHVSLDDCFPNRFFLPGTLVNHDVNPRWFKQCNGCHLLEPSAIAIVDLASLKVKTWREDTQCIEQSHVIHLTLYQICPVSYQEEEPNRSQKVLPGGHCSSLRTLPNPRRTSVSHLRRFVAAYKLKISGFTI